MKNRLKSKGRALYAPFVQRGAEKVSGTFFQGTGVATAPK
jgi:hypothetical protein